MKKDMIIILFLLVTLALSGSTVYFYSQYRTLVKTIPQESELSFLMRKVGSHVLLPEGETPTVMTVTDKEKLSGQLFFANAKNGDKVLIYQQAKKAFLYDPDADRVIEIGPVTFGPADKGNQATGSAALQQIRTRIATPSGDPTFTASPTAMP